MTLILPKDRNKAQITTGTTRIVLGILDDVTMPGEQILGVENTPDMRVLITNWTEGDRFLDVDTAWQPGTEIDRVTFTRGFKEFTLPYSALEAEENEEFLRLHGNDPAIVANARFTRSRYAAFAGGFVRRRHEIAREALLTDTANYGSNFVDLNGGAEWGTATGDALDDVTTGAIAIRKATGVGMQGLRMYVSPTVWDKAKFDPKFVAFRTSGGHTQTAGNGTLEEFGNYLGLPGRVFTDATGIQVIKSRGGVRESVWGRDVVLYVDFNIIPNAAEWGVPRFGIVWRNSGASARTPYFLPEHGRVWRFPWISLEDSFILTSGAGFLFKNAVEA